MHKHIFLKPEYIGKTKSFGFVEPFDPGRFQWTVGQCFRVDIGQIGQTGPRGLFGRLDRQHADRLHAAVGLLHRHLDPRAIGNRTLAEIAQDIGMQQNIRPAVIGNHKPKSLGRIEPFDESAHGPPVVWMVGIHLCSSMVKAPHRTRPSCG